ncbi:MAG: DUF4019 domain-containing protein [Gemmatimonadales bacterium]
MRPTALATLLAAVLALPGGGVVAQADSGSRQQAETAATEWLRLVDAGKYAASWEAAASAFRSAVTPADWERSVTRARAGFVPISSRTLLSATYAERLPGAPAGQYYVLRFRVHGTEDGIETVVPMKDAGTWKVSGYFIRPAD